MSALLEQGDGGGLPALPPPRSMVEVVEEPVVSLRRIPRPRVDAGWGNDSGERQRQARRRWLLAALPALALLAAGIVWATYSASEADTVADIVTPLLPGSASAPPAPVAALSRSAPRVAEGTAPSRPLPRVEELLQRAGATPFSPEARLLRIYALMAMADGDRALEEARKLAQDVPTFSLAHLAYADLLKARTAPLPAFGAAKLPPVAAPASGAADPRDTGGVASAPAERLKDLWAEARARVGTSTGLPPPGTVPAPFVFLSPTVRHAIAVDASRSRLYLFENTPKGLVLKRDFYASVGKLGTAKRVEGDLRTPLGVYFVTGRLSKAKLADRYGASAMVLNYPNQYDQLRGRTGSGIWLHGVESSYFSRAPLATDGCVALSNGDLLGLTADVDRQATPVIIAERIDWVPPAAAAQPLNNFNQAFEAWRSARQTADPSRELALYAHPDAALLRPVVAASGAAANWVDVLRAERARAGSAAAQITQLSVLAWHDQDDVMLVTYSETTARDAHPRVKRQYWLRRDEGWRIVFDGAVG